VLVSDLLHALAAIWSVPRDPPWNRSVDERFADDVVGRLRSSTSYAGMGARDASERSPASSL